VNSFKPDYIIQFAPIISTASSTTSCRRSAIGAGAISLGDWGGGTGPLNVPEQTALTLLEHVRADDFDVALSYRMPVDHGFVQMWEAMLGDFRSIPIVPIFVNGAAPPLPTYRRARACSGESVGRFAAASGKRVLFAASGGLSHDPPLPSMRDATPEVRERLIDGRNPSPQARQSARRGCSRQAQLAEAGRGPCMPLKSCLGRRVHGDAAQRPDIEGRHAQHRHGTRGGRAWRQ